MLPLIQSWFQLSHWFVIRSTEAIPLIEYLMVRAYKFSHGFHSTFGFRWSIFSPCNRDKQMLELLGLCLCHDWNISRIIIICIHSYKNMCTMIPVKRINRMHCTKSFSLEWHSQKCVNTKYKSIVIIFRFFSSFFVHLDFNVYHFLSMMRPLSRIVCSKIQP